MCYFLEEKKKGRMFEKLKLASHIKTMQDAIKEVNKGLCPFIGCCPKLGKHLTQNGKCCECIEVFFREIEKKAMKKLERRIKLRKS